MEALSCLNQSFLSMLYLQFFCTLFQEVVALHLHLKFFKKEIAKKKLSLTILEWHICRRYRDDMPIFARIAVVISKQNTQTNLFVKSCAKPANAKVEQSTANMANKIKPVFACSTVISTWQTQATKLFLHTFWCQLAYTYKWHTFFMFKFYLHNLFKLLNKFAYNYAQIFENFVFSPQNFIAFKAAMQTAKSMQQLKKKVTRNGGNFQTLSYAHTHMSTRTFVLASVCFPFLCLLCIIRLSIQIAANPIQMRT